MTNPIKDIKAMLSGIRHKQEKLDGQGKESDETGNLLLILTEARADLKAKCVSLEDQLRKCLERE